MGPLFQLVLKRLATVRSLMLAIVALVSPQPRMSSGQALTMDGSSGVFFQPLANVVPAPAKKWNHPTLSYHMVSAGPVAGDYINVSLEEGFGNWFELGYTRGNHTDGGDAAFSPLFNYAGMNIFNAKVKVIAEGSHGHGWLPSLA